jgi:hypothetical protein
LPKRDYVLDARWAEGDYSRFAALIAELTRGKPSLILVTTIVGGRGAGPA